MTIPLPSAETVEAYAATDYYAHDVGKVKARIGDRPEQHRGWLESRGARTATILTAWNPFGETTAADRNDRAQRRLLAAIAAAGLDWVPASGEDPRGHWAPEPGFCVFDAPPTLVDDWLVDFRQNAAVRIAADEDTRLVWHPAIRSAGSD